MHDCSDIAHSFISQLIFRALEIVKYEILLSSRRSFAKFAIFFSGALRCCVILLLLKCVSIPCFPWYISFASFQALSTILEATVDAFIVAGIVVVVIFCSHFYCSANRSSPLLLRHSFFLILRCFCFHFLFNMKNRAKDKYIFATFYCFMNMCMKTNISLISAASCIYGWKLSERNETPEGRVPPTMRVSVCVCAWVWQNEATYIFLEGNLCQYLLARTIEKMRKREY